MYEPKSKPVLTAFEFFKRMYMHTLLVVGVMFLALFMGMCGYHYIESLPWVDSFLNAAMILGGMGEVDPIKTEAGKIFAGSYALFSGLWVITSMGILLAPVLHRIAHRMHAT